MSRRRASGLVAHPWLALAVLGVWLLLNQSLSLGQILLGSGLGLLASATMRRLDEPEEARLRSPVALLRLLGFVAVEIVRSNIAVARIVVAPRAERRSGFLRIPLEIREPRSLAILACILTATPGSLWVSYDTARGELLLHVLDLIDEADWVGIVRRYEARLKEILS